MSTTPLTVSERLGALNTYLDGKIKRYNLMFAVNGGAFVLAKLLKGADTENFLGRLTLAHLAIGAIGFTFLMWFDIWLWGESMRLRYFPGDNEGVFRWRGKAILCLLASLLIVGWLLAVSSWTTALTIFAILVGLGALLIYQHRNELARRRAG